jgi:hypothetical protein
VRSARAKLASKVGRDRAANRAALRRKPVDLAPPQRARRQRQIAFAVGT